MADQIERSVAALIVAINRINESIQKLGDYDITYAFGTGAVVEITGVAALLAGIAIDTELIGTIAATTSSSGVMADFVRALAVSVDADTNITSGDLQVITELIGSLTETSVLASVFSDATILLKAVSDSLAVIDGNINTIKPLIGSSVGAATGAAAKLWT